MTNLTLHPFLAGKPRGNSFRTSSVNANLSTCELLHLFKVCSLFRLSSVLTTVHRYSVCQDCKGRLPLHPYLTVPPDIHGQSHVCSSSPSFCHPTVATLGRPRSRRKSSRKGSRRIQLSPGTSFSLSLARLLNDPVPARPHTILSDRHCVWKRRLSTLPQVRRQELD